MSEKQKAREAWIKRYTGLFGDPPRLSDYRAGLLTFEELYHSSIKTAENMVTEAENVSPEAFDCPTP